MAQFKYTISSWKRRSGQVSPGIQLLTTAGSLTGSVPATHVSFNLISEDGHRRRQGHSDGSEVVAWFQRITVDPTSTTQHSATLMRLWFYSYGSSPGVLHRTGTSGLVRTLAEIQGPVSNYWERLELAISSSFDFQTMMVAVQDFGVRSGVIAIDDITHTDGCAVLSE